LPSGAQAAVSAPRTFLQPQQRPVASGRRCRQAFAQQLVGIDVETQRLAHAQGILQLGFVVYGLQMAPAVEQMNVGAPGHRVVLAQTDTTCKWPVHHPVRRQRRL